MTRRLAVAAASVAAALTLPAAATGQGAAPAPAPAGPVKAELTITPEKVNGDEHAVLAGQQWRVRGEMDRFVSDQEVVVRFYRGGKKILAKGVTVQPGEDGTGQFKVSFKTSKDGRVTIRASHRATPRLDTAVAEEQTVDVLPRRVKRGSKGRSVRILQRRLDRLGFVVGKRGVFDARTARAVLAYRKSTGLKRTTEASSAVMRRLARGAGRFKVRHESHGRHIEADLSKQIIALIGEDGEVERIYPTSSGKPSTPTIRGSFRVYRRDIGTLASGMVHSAFFKGGYAIHGYKSVPTYPASAGCLRVPIPDALAIRNWTRMGTIVDVYA